MSKRPYEATSIKDVDVEHLAEQFDYEHLQVGIDVAKETHYACLMGPHWEHYYLFEFNARRQMDALIGLLEGLASDEIVCALEPTGTYSDPLREELERNGFETERLEAEKCGQARELFDDVPSLHDGKSAYLVARLGLLELTEQWKDRSERDRQLRAILAELNHAEQQLDRLTGKMEAALARHWPELTVELKLRSATLQALIAEYGSPQRVAADPEGVRETMRRASRGRVGQERIEAVVESARETTGAGPIEREVDKMKRFAEKMREASAEIRQFRHQLDEVIDTTEAAADGETDSCQERADSLPSSEIGRLRDFGGTKLASVLVARLGAPSEFDSAAAYQKAAGLNLKVKSSGQSDGQPTITKKGPGAVRHNLFMLACRMVRGEPHGCPYVKAWYEERLRRNGGIRLKGLVAVMRKLIGAIYHIGRGDAYDPRQLFDVSRLDLPARN